LTFSNSMAPRPFQALLSVESSDISVFNMDCKEPLAWSNFAAVLAITADSACVWATPDVTPLPSLNIFCAEIQCGQDRVWTIIDTRRQGHSG